MKIRFEKCRHVKSPTKAHSLDAGIDFFVPYEFNGEAPMALKPHERISIPSGIRVDIPAGYALIAYNKSGVANKKGLVHTAGVCDSGYQGEVYMSVLNASEKLVEIRPGEKLLQFLLLPVPQVEVEEAMTGTLFIKGGSERGEGSNGSTGDR